METISECRRRLYDHFHGSQSCQSHFFDATHADDYAAYYTAMYLLQDSTEALSAHRERGFASDSFLAYIELWGVMQAINIQQDAIKKLYELLTAKGFPSYTGKWKEIRDLRVLCAGHPVDKGEARKQPAVRTFAGRHFGDYDEVTLESYREDGRNTEHVKIKLGVLIDAYAREAVGFLEQAETEMKRRWP
jgi:hypothetical protein